MSGSLSHRSLFACLAAACAIWMGPTWALAEEPPALEIHEWSVWLWDSSSNQLNAQANYPSVLPAVVDSLRKGRQEPSGGNPGPLSMITFRGKPPASLDLSLRMGAGRFLAHWPPAEIKNNRLSWTNMKLSGESNEASYATAPESHWIQQARKLDTLQVEQSGRAEKFAAYDPELKVSLPIRVEGGPDKYQVINAGKYPFKDLLLVVPAEKGCRIGWLDELPAAAGSKPADTSSKTADDKKDATASKEKTASKQTSAVKEISASIEMTALLTDKELTTQGVEALRKRLDAAGLGAKEIDLLLSIYSQAIFHPSEAVLLMRLSPSTIDEWMPMEVDPETSKITRTALVLCQKVDPKIREQVQQLVEDLGNKEYAKREQAEQRLRELGPMAAPALKAATKGNDPERVMRVERLLLQQKETLDGK